MNGLTYIELEFEWDIEKEEQNKEKHGVDFQTAKNAFSDPLRVVFVDEAHSDTELRFFCMGKIDNTVLTVRFTYRDDRIRIFGAQWSRKGQRIYNEENLI